MRRTKWRFEIMARKATTRAGKGRTSGQSKGSSSRAPVRSQPRTGERRTGERRSGGGSQDTMGEAFIKLLQSPLVADLVAVAATAALASLAEHGFTSRGADDSSRRNRAAKAVKEAGKAAAAAVGRRLANEIDEIRKAAKEPKAGAKA
jgi:hypothetical protein